ncbi:MAG: class I SAM-dependent methyltransferase [Pseudomonadota bacterium]
MKCRFCESPLQNRFVDLGLSPLANEYLKPDQLKKGQRFFPLQAYVCDQCFLVQLDSFETPSAIFSDYAYFSSYSRGWLAHAERYVAMMIERFSLGSHTQVIEIASNDGYLLQYFKEFGVPILGIEPALNVAQAAIAKGISTHVDFFGTSTAKHLVQQSKQADVLIANNVLAHVPDLNDFVEGLSLLLKPNGILTLEFPHLLHLIEEIQFDTMYHEHFSYFSLYTIEKVLEAYKLCVVDVDELLTHGGSLRLYVRHESYAEHASKEVEILRMKELKAGLKTLNAYLKFEAEVERIKYKILEFLIQAKVEGKRVAAYGAPAKGNTLLNYCGIRHDLIEFTVDVSPHKQGRLLPGSLIPIYAPEKVLEVKPDYLFILPWNLREEIIEQMAVIREWGGKFVIPMPHLEVKA